MLLALAEKLAALKGTEVIAHRFNEDETAIIFVLESGPKYTMTEEELRAAIREAQPSEPFDYVEQQIAKEQQDAGSNGGAVAPPPANGGSTPEPPKIKTRTRKGKETK